MEPQASGGEIPELVSPEERSSTGLDPRVAAVLAYLLGLVSGLVFLALERESRFVRFHAMQSALTFGGLLFVRIACGLIPLVGGVLSAAVTLGGIVLWLHLMYRAWKGQLYKLPWLGERAVEYIGGA